MLLVAESGRENEVLRVFEKWGLDGVIVGTVKPEPRLRIHHHGVLVADIPNQSLTDDAPLYHRPVGVWKTPAPALPSERIQAALSEDRDFTADLITLLSSSNTCSKRWVYEQYDTMVQPNTVIGPGGEGGVMRIKGTGTKTDDGVRHERGLSMALDGNGRWAYLNPKLGAMHAVAEAARKVAMTGATPVAATNCLNFGNPEKPEIMAQLSAAIDGIAEACTALSTPITGGNVSLYNETRGVGIYPTPVLGIVGILDDVTLAVPAHFKKGGDAIVLLWPIPAGSEPDPNLKVPFPGAQVESSADPYSPLLGSPTSLHPEAVEDDATVAEELIVFGSSEYASAVLGGMWGQPPSIDLDAEADLHTLLAVLAERQLIHSARDISDGGIAVSLAQAGFPLDIGATVEQDQSLLAHPLFGLFAEPASTVLVTCEANQVETIEELADGYGYFAARIGTTGGNKLEISVYRQPMISASLASLRKPWASALEATLHGEVLA
jgi:phosphoribosylformylglycinamidine synthase